MPKIKIVQIESFYQSFLNQYYESNPYIIRLNYENQITKLLESGWSSGQNVVPRLNPSKFECHYIIPTHIKLQRLWAQEKNLNSNELNLDQILLYQLEQIQPDIIYLSDISCFNFKIIELLSKKPFVIAWHATELNETINWKSIDLLLSGITSIRKRASFLGVKDTNEFMSGAPSFQNINNFISHVSGGDICFSGSFIGGLHDQRAQLFNQLSNEIKDYNFDIYTSNDFAKNSGSLKFFPAVYASDVINTYSNYKIVIDARADFGLNEDLYEAETSNMRIFEATKAGALLITPNASNINKYFEINSDIVTYSSYVDLVEKIHYFLDPANENKRKIIAYNGYKKTITDHSIEKRSVWFEEIINSKFSTW